MNKALNKTENGANELRESKSQQKREMERLQKIGVSLVKLNEGLLERFNLSEELLLAIKEARNIRSNSALRRQFQYIGKLMRKADVDNITEQLAIINNQSAHATRILHLAEMWREKLLNSDEELNLFILEYPNVEVKTLRMLIRMVRKELAAKQSFNYRKLYQFIREVIKETQQL